MDKKEEEQEEGGGLNINRLQKFFRWIFHIRGNRYPKGSLAWQRWEYFKQDMRDSKQAGAQE
jgi:hypothetical protein